MTVKIVREERRPETGHRKFSGSRCARHLAGRVRAETGAPTFETMVLVIEAIGPGQEIHAEGEFSVEGQPKGLWVVCCSEPADLSAARACRSGRCPDGGEQRARISA